MLLMKKLSILFFCCGFITIAFSQIGKDMPAIPQMRQIFHQNIDNNQIAIIHLNGKTDTVFTATDDLDVNLQVTQFLKVRINNLQAKIETDTAFNENEKYTWLRGINQLLSDFINAYKTKQIKGIVLSDLIIAFENAMQYQQNAQSIAPVIDSNDIEIASLLTQNFAFQKNTGINDCKNLIVLKLCRLNEPNVLSILTKYPDVPFADSIIAAKAHQQPEDVYDFAAANNLLGKKIRNNTEPLVKLISHLANIEKGRSYFPFLDKLYHQEITIDSIEAAAKNEDVYYKLLVATEINYADRAAKKDTPLVMHVLTEKLRSKAIEVYIREINALHDEKSDAVRFKILDNLLPKELYYLCVLGEEEIYTSSYLGVYNRIFQRMNMPRSDTLFRIVHFDFYRKFIKMAAAYNTLDDCIKRMDNSEAEKLMRNFVNNLDKNSSLEDAVDVADSYASINAPNLKKIILTQLQSNITLAQKTKNTRGLTIYQLLNNIFLSIENTDNAGMYQQIGIPPVYNMPNQLLKDSSGNIVVLQFFYGDKDGGNVFNGFLNTFSNNNWKITRKAEWAEVRSVRGTPITIYSNKPLDETKDLDAKAQEDLLDYLDSLQIQPTVTIHRGHSYYVKSTIKQLPSSSKVILLGSCGGYNSLNDVLKTCNGAHIIASKQVGTGVVNITLIETMMETLRQGKDLNWPAIWKNLDTRFKGDMKDRFEDYVPPHKNLGAIFIMAYNKLIESSTN
jgi:hypothetical protein